MHSPVPYYLIFHRANLCQIPPVLSIVAYPGLLENEKDAFFKAHSVLGKGMEIPVRAAGGLRFGRVGI